MSDKEKEFLETVKGLDKGQMERLYNFMQKSIICSRTFGEEYHNEIQPFVESQNAEKLEEITNKYIARLSTNGTEILIDGATV